MESKDAVTIPALHQMKRDGKKIVGILSNTDIFNAIEI